MLFLAVRLHFVGGVVVGMIALGTSLFAGAVDGDGFLEEGAEGWEGAGDDDDVHFCAVWWSTDLSAG